MEDKLLPPMPKLRPRPGLAISTENPPPPLKKRKIVPQEESKKNQGAALEIIEEDAKTSRLLTKSECGRGGGRKRNSGSTIHSIPKFSQVQQSEQTLFLLPGDPSNSVTFDLALI